MAWNDRVRTQVSADLGGSIGTTRTTGTTDTADQPSQTQLGTYGGTIGNTPPGSQLVWDEKIGWVLQLPVGYAGIGGVGDTGALTYIPWNPNPDGSWTPQMTAAVNAIKAGNYTGNFADYAQGGAQDPAKTGGGAGTGAGTGTDGAGTGTGGTATEDAFETKEGKSIFAAINAYLEDWGLGALAPWVEQQIRNGTPQEQILTEIRRQDAYKEAFPEQEMRRRNGYTPLSEREIHAYRNEVKRLAMDHWGARLSTHDAAKLLGKNVSVSEWEHRLQVGRRVQELGGGVQQVFMRSIGRPLNAMELQMFFDPEIDTRKEFDELYERSIYTGYQKNLGINREVTGEMEQALRARGISTDQAMANYLRLASALPSIDRLAAIDATIAKDTNNPFDSWQSAFAAFNNLDPREQERISNLFAQETARARSGGGVAFQGLAAVGLSRPTQRQ